MRSERTARSAPGCGARVAALVIALAGAFAADARAQATFTHVGHLPNSFPSSGIQALSDDGSTVGGLNVLGQGETFATLWQGDGPLVSIGDLPGGIRLSHTFGLSADGSVAVGFATPESGFNGAFRYENGVMTQLEPLAGELVSIAYDVNADGSVVVGTTLPPRQSFRWESGVMVGLGFGPQPGFQGRARAVSADGNVIVGSGTNFTIFEGYRWEGGVFTGLGDLPGGDFGSEAYDVSPDGTIIVGRGLGTDGWQAVRWIDGEIEPLGELPGGTFDGVALGVTADGRMAVGRSNTDAGVEAFLWTEADGMRRLQDVLVDDFGLAAELEGWRLEVAHRITPDGRRLVGDAFNPDGDREGFIVDLPVATGIPALPIGFFGLLGGLLAATLVRSGRARV